MGVRLRRGGMRLLNLEDLSAGPLIIEGGGKVAWSPNGKKIASGRPKIFDAESWLKLKESPHAPAHPLLAWSPDGVKLATCSTWGGQPLQIWDSEKGGEPRDLAKMTDIKDLVWSPDGKRLATAEDVKGVKIWDVETGKLSRPPFTLNWATSLLWVEGGKTLAGCCNGVDVLFLWDPETGEDTKVQLGNNRMDLLSSFDGEYLAGMDAGGLIQLLHIPTRRLVAGIQGAGRITVRPSHGGFALGLGGEVAASAWCWGASTLHLWATRSGAPIGTFTALSDGKHLLVSPEGHYRGEGIEGEIVYVAETEDGRQVKLEPAEFEKTYDWKNDASKIRPPGKILREAEPAAVDLPRGKPASPLAIVTSPEKIDGVRSWTIETVSHRGANEFAWPLPASAHGNTLTLVNAKDGKGLESEPERYLFRGNVCSLSCDPDGKLVATGGVDGTVRLWDAQTKEKDPVRILPGHSREVLAVAWSPDGKTLASGSLDGDVRLWDVTAYRPRRSPIPCGVEVGGIAWSPDGKRLAAWPPFVPNPAAPVLIDVSAGKATILLRIKDEPVRPISMAWQDAETIVATGREGVTFWSKEGVLRDAETWAEPGLGVLSRDAKKLACLHPGKVKVWDIADRKPIASFDVEGVARVIWSPSGKRILVDGKDKRIAVIEALSGKVVQEIKGLDLSSSQAVDWLSGEKVLVAAQRAGAVGFWDLETTSDSGFGLEKFGVHCIELSPDRRGLVLSTTLSIRMFDIARGEDLLPIQYPPNDKDETFRWSLDGKYLAMKGGHTLRIRVAETGDLQTVAGPNPGPIHGVAWDPKSSLLAFSAFSQIQFWDPKERRLDGMPISREGPAIGAMEWSPDWKTIAASCPNGSVETYDPLKRVRLWNVPLEKPASLAWSPDSQRLAVCTGGSSPAIHILDRDTGRFSETKLDPRLPGLTPFKPRWSPDGGSIFASGVGGNHSTGCAAFWWDVASGKVLRSFEADGGAVSPDLEILASPVLNTIRFRDARTGKLLGTLVLFKDLGRRLLVSPEGHMNAEGMEEKDLEKDLRYVVETSEGEFLTLTPSAFREKYPDFRNDLKKAGFLDRLAPSRAK
jgi:WD40 repeat protein